MASNYANQIWVEHYRPLHVKDIIMPASFKTYFSKMIADNCSNNLLLYSPEPGTGKTTLAEAIARDLNADVLEINASSDNGIATAREKIATFAATRSFKKTAKIVILDEADGATPALQQALRGYIEQYAKTCRFILTCNFLSKIIKPLQEGRTQVFDFNMSRPEFKAELQPKIFARLTGILQHEHVEYQEDIIKQLIDTCYPSIRKMIALLQKYSSMYGKIDDGILQFKAVSSELGDFIKKKNLTAARNYMMSNGFSCTDIFNYLANEYIPAMEHKYRAQSLMIVGNWEPQCAFSSMPDLMVACAMMQIMELEGT